MSSHSANPIFFNFKKKTGGPEHLVISPRSDNISFFPTPSLKEQRERHMCVIPNTISIYRRTKIIE